MTQHAWDDIAECCDESRESNGSQSLSTAMLFALSINSISCENDQHVASS